MTRHRRRYSPGVDQLHEIRRPGAQLPTPAPPPLGQLLAGVLGGALVGLAAGLAVAGVWP